MIFDREPSEPVVGARPTALILAVLIVVVGAASLVLAHSLTPLWSMVPAVTLLGFTLFDGWRAPMMAALAGALLAALAAVVIERATDHPIIWAISWALVLLGGAWGWIAAAGGRSDADARAAGMRVARVALIGGGLNLAALAGLDALGLLPPALLIPWYCLVGGGSALGAALLLGGALAWLAVPAAVALIEGAAQIGAPWLPDIQPLAMLWPALVVGMGGGAYLAARRTGNRAWQRNSRMITAFSLVMLVPRALGQGESRKLMLPLMAAGALLLLGGRGES